MERTHGECRSVFQDRRSSFDDAAVINLGRQWNVNAYERRWPHHWSPPAALSGPPLDLRTDSLSSKMNRNVMKCLAAASVELREVHVHDFL